MKANRIYVRLLGEGAMVYRPVDAERVGENVYKILDDPTIDDEDEILEFQPFDVVAIEDRILDGERHRVAVKKIEM